MISRASSLQNVQLGLEVLLHHIRSFQLPACICLTNITAKKKEYFELKCPKRSYDIRNDLVFVYLPVRLFEQINVLAGPKSIHYFVHFLQRGVAIEGVHLSIPHKSNTYDASCDCYETYLGHSSPGIGMG